MEINLYAKHKHNSKIMIRDSFLWETKKEERGAKRGFILFANEYFMENFCGTNSMSNAVFLVLQCLFFFLLFQVYLVFISILKRGAQKLRKSIVICRSVMREFFFYVYFSLSPAFFRTPENYQTKKKKPQAINDWYLIKSNREFA